MERFPVGGERQRVYDFLRQFGYVMSNWSDKAWSRADGVELHVYGAGSKALIKKDGKVWADAPLYDAVTQCHSKRA